MMKKLITIVMLMLFSTLSVAQSQIELSNEVTGAKSWELKQDGVVFYLNQLLPDQLRAFYSNRGFSQQQIASYAQSCVFMTVLRNESAAGVVRYKIEDWRVKHALSEQSIKSVDKWIEDLKAFSPKKSALIAFRWAQFPPQQEYEPGGDWNQGMLSLGANKQPFDVIAKWSMNNKTHKITLSGVRCAL